MSPVKNHLVPRFKGGYLLQNIRTLQDGLVRRINVNHQLILLFIAVLAWFPVIQVLDDPENGEIPGMVALVRAQGSKEPAFPMNYSRKFRFRHMIRQQFPGRQFRIPLFIYPSRGRNGRIFSQNAPESGQAQTDG